MTLNAINKISSGFQLLDRKNFHISEVLLQRSRSTSLRLYSNKIVSQPNAEIDKKCVLPPVTEDDTQTS